MIPILHRSFLSGKLNGIFYRGLLDVTLQDQTFHISSPLGDATIAIATIEEVKQICNIVEFGIRVRYRDPSGAHVIAFRTRKYKAWGAAFRQLGVTVIPPKGWFSDLL
jgi:hypothetical protein